MLEKHSWNTEAAKFLHKELVPDEAQIQAEVEKGISTLWKIHGQTGWLVTRLEELEVGEKELVLVAIRGSDVGKVLDYIKSKLPDIGVKKMRFHSSRPGAGKFVKQFGFYPVETVYRWEYVGR